MDTTFISLYQRFEALGRAQVIANLLARPGFANPQPTTDPYARADLFIDSPAGRVAIEVKMRSALYPSGQLIEEDKLQALLAIRAAGQADWCYYANVIGQDVYYWLIDERALELPLYTKVLPRTTAEAKGGRPKQYRLLPLTLAIR